METGQAGPDTNGDLIFKLLIMVISHKTFHANLKLKTPLKCYISVSVKL